MKPLFYPTLGLSTLALCALLVSACSGTPAVPDDGVGNAQVSDIPEPDGETEEAPAPAEEQPAEDEKKPKVANDDPFAADDNEYASGAGNFKPPEKKKTEVVPDTPAEPELMLGAPMVKGGDIKPAEVMLRVAKNQGQIEACFDKRIKAKGPGGSVIVSFTIKATGAVRQAKVAKSTLKDKKIDKCVLQVFESMMFQASTKAKAAKVQYPVTLTAP